MTASDRRQQGVGCVHPCVEDSVYSKKKQSCSASLCYGSKAAVFVCWVFVRNLLIEVRTQIPTRQTQTATVNADPDAPLVLLPSSSLVPSFLWLGMNSWMNGVFDSQWSHKVYIYIYQRTGTVYVCVFRGHAAQRAEDSKKKIGKITRPRHAKQARGVWSPSRQS